MMDDGREDKKPWDKWFWQDWDSDKGLQACGLAAKGLWIEMLSIMAKSKSKGKLLDNESKMESKTLAKLVRSTPDAIDPLLAELKDHGVYSQDTDGIIFNRRMLRESHISEVRSEAGKLGGRPKSKTKANVESKTKGPSAYASSISYINLKWEGIGEGDIAAWKEAYPACDLDLELRRMIEWLKANPKKAVKSNYRRFITNWLTRAQDKGGTKGANVLFPKDDLEQKIQNDLRKR
jgi:hypothetical protein